MGLLDEGSMGKAMFTTAVDPAIEALLQLEDLDNDSKITIDDCGPKVWH